MLKKTIAIERKNELQKVNFERHAADALVKEEQVGQSHHQNRWHAFISETVSRLSAPIKPIQTPNKVRYGERWVVALITL